MSDCAPRAPTAVSVHTNTISDARCATLRTSDLSAVDAFLASGTRHAYARVDVTLVGAGADLKQSPQAVKVDAASQTAPLDRAVSPDTSEDESKPSRSPVRAAPQQDVQAVHGDALMGTARAPGVEMHARAAR